ncbi:cyclophilin-like fold protein [Pseudactinotalea suaedae]|uniref:cyclophilin-like fold protein n=1 Tax=Pseudactinotalea suaedae TaxID=1524924 RepID=UPI001F4F4EEA|nr:cyclophilin-like fold protein [Pseudactinotalea suaedae]
MAHRARFALAASLVLAIAACSTTGSTTDRAEVRLDDAAPAVQLAEVLSPDDTLSFSSSLGTAHVADLSQPLEVQDGSPMTSYRAGDVAYWPRQQRVVIFLAHGSAVPTGGLIQIGRVVTGLDYLDGCARDCQVRLSAPTSEPLGLGRDR